MDLRKTGRLYHTLLKHVRQNIKMSSAAMFVWRFKG